MRVQIGKENEDFGFGHVVMPGGFVWDEDKVYPIEDRPREGNPSVGLIGTARDLRREDDGTITAEVTIPEHPMLRGYLTIFGNKLEFEEGRGVEGPPPILVKSVTIKAIFVDVNTPWGKEIVDDS